MEHILFKPVQYASMNTLNMLETRQELSATDVELLAFECFVVVLLLLFGGHFGSFPSKPMRCRAQRNFFFFRRLHLTVCLFVGWLLNVPATCECISGTDLLNFTCYHTDIEVADQTFYLTQSQYTDTGPTSPSTDPITPGA